jgi:hypothetical protein
MIAMQRARVVGLLQSTIARVMQKEDGEAQVLEHWRKMQAEVWGKMERSKVK